MNNTPQLEKKIFISGDIRTQTGLMIGSSSSAMDIGGVDKAVIRHPITKLPYIPGSSLKGKLRSLLELHLGNVSENRGGRSKSYGPTHNPEHLPARLFGHIKHKEDNNNESQQPSRVIVRDGDLRNGEQLNIDTELLFTEVKAENSIDRITSAANPRFFERVPQGARFKLEVILNVFSNDDEEEFLKGLFQAMRLVQDDYLGGGGSRGNGQIVFNISRMEERGKDYYLNPSPDNIEDRTNEVPEDLRQNS